jgi:LL-diaminopimelate aminotransferase
MDSGMFLPLQLAAAKALSLPGSWYEEVNAVYKKRRSKAIELLELLDLKYDPDQSGMFLWAAVPETHADGYALSDQVLQQARVFITPGGIFGPSGLKFVRISLCSTEEKMEMAIGRIKKAGL